jgi:hypothetical protein
VTSSNPARVFRVKSFSEYLRDYEMPDDPADKFRHLNAILTGYARSQGWDYLRIGDELF